MIGNVLLGAALIISLAVMLACSMQKEPSAKLIKLENNGRTVYFGRYPQNESSQTRSGTDPIEWVVLKQGKGKLLLISRYALKCEKYPR